MEAASSQLDVCMPETMQFENVRCERAHEIWLGGPRFTDARTVEVQRVSSKQIQIINRHPKKAPAVDAVMSPGTRISRDGVTVTIGGRVMTLDGVRVSNQIQNINHRRRWWPDA